jgi:hypothetical protein
MGSGDACGAGAAMDGRPRRRLNPGGTVDTLKIWSVELFALPGPVTAFPTRWVIVMRNTILVVCILAGGGLAAPNAAWAASRFQFLFEFGSACG